MEKRWNVLHADPAVVKELQQSIGINQIICNILAQRGIDTFEKAKDYYRPQLAHMHSPWLMKDM